MWMLDTEPWYFVIAVGTLIHGVTAPAHHHHPLHTSLLFPESRKLKTAYDSPDFCAESTLSPWQVRLLAGCASRLLLSLVSLQLNPCLLLCPPTLQRLEPPRPGPEPLLCLPMVHTVGTNTWIC